MPARPHRTIRKRLVFVGGLTVLHALGCGGDARAPGAEGETAGDGTETTSATTAGTGDASATTAGETGDQHRVSAIVFGLQGDSVELELMGETLSIDADGEYDFGATFADGTSFEVVAAKQPEGPDQDCRIEGNGVVSGYDAQVLVTCVTPIRHVVVVGIDGFGGEYVSTPNTPTLDGLMAESTWSLDMQNALPTMSSTNWMSMIDGSSPDQHGVLSNAWQPGDSSPPTTMFAALRAAKPAAKIGVFHDWADFDRLVELDVTDAMNHPGDESQTMAAALAWFADNDPDLLFVHLDHVDHAGHLNTWGSGAYVDAAESADALVGDLVATLENLGAWPYTALIVSADHGGSGFTHGADTALERPIPFILRTPQGSATPLFREVRIWDIAPTVLELLGVAPPEVWVGRSIREGLFDRPSDHAPSGPIVTALAADYVKLWDDTGSLALADVSIWRPVVPEGFVALSDVAVAGHEPPTGGTLVVRTEDQIAFAPPVGFEQIWNSGGSGANASVTLWHPIPERGYTCLGTFATETENPPALDSVRCLRHELLVSAPTTKLWDDTASGATWDASLWNCSAGAGANFVPRAFFTRRHHDGPGYSKCFGLKETFLGN